MGRVDGNDVRSGNGSLLGRTEGLSGRLAALYFFFLR